MSERSPHPLPVCEALEQLGLSGAEVARSLGFHPNIWSKWRAGQSPHARTRAALLVLARRFVADARALIERQTFSALMASQIEDTLRRVAELIAAQEMDWGTPSIAGLLQADRKLASLSLPPLPQPNP
jgi:transcriptional regulator with XRE-family HTH domain